MSEALLRTIIHLGQNLGVVVLGEGVETQEQRQWLADKDCLYLQGHLFGWPKPVEYYQDGFKVELSELEHFPHTENTESNSQPSLPIELASSEQT